MKQLRLTDTVTAYFEREVRVEGDFLDRLQDPAVGLSWKKAKLQQRCRTFGLVPVFEHFTRLHIAAHGLADRPPAAYDFTDTKSPRIMKQTIKLMSVPDVARIVHEVNMAYLESIHVVPVRWESLSEERQEHSIAMVEFFLEQPDMDPRTWHTGWVEQMERDGWKYGKVQDNTKKENPSLLPYDSLPTQQQTTYYLIQQIIRSLQPFLTE